MLSSSARRHLATSMIVASCIGLTFTGCANKTERQPTMIHAARYAKPLGPIEWLAHSDRFKPITPDSRYPRVPDSWLKWRVESILLAPEFAGASVEVEKQNVVLTGRVDSAEAEQRLVEAVKGVYGVAHIEELLRIEP